MPKRQQWKKDLVCIICGEKIYQFQRFNWDHLIPISRGGPRGHANKYPAHVICNAVKSNQWPFWLRTGPERNALRGKVREQTWHALIRAWCGLPD